MRFRFQPITPNDAEAIVLWRYPSPFDLYDMNGPASRLLEPSYHYHVAHEEEQVVAFLCWGEDARVSGFDYDDSQIDVGWGLRPDCTGRGLGSGFIGEVVAFVEGRAPGARLRASVAAFNARCQKACGAVGFTDSECFTRPSDGMSFLVMTLDDVGSAAKFGA